MFQNQELRKNSQLNIGVSVQEKKLLALAARSRKVTVTEFILRSCAEAMNQESTLQLPVLQTSHRRSL